MQIRFLLSLLFISLLLSCKKEPLLNVYSDSVSFSEKGGSQSLSFVTNNEWSASVAGGSWLSLSSRSGDPGNASLSVSADVNDSFEERSGTITISSGPLSKTIAVSQVKNRGVIITNKQYEVPTEGGDIKVEVKSNVDFETLIPDDSKEWISALSTKGLVGNSFDFRISANPTNNNRIGKIVFKDKSSDVSDTVRVIQAQKDAIILTQRNYSLSDTAIVINVELKSNVQYMVTIPMAVQSWVSQVGTKAMMTEILSFGIAANKSRQSRNAEIIFFKSLTTISDTLKITQAEAPLPPSVTTKSASAIKPYSAVMGGIVTADGGAPVLARGLCWSVSPNPTVSDFKSNNGSGNGSFESEITGLNPDTKYYVRAYATNRAGTSYGNEVSFITADTDLYPGTDYPSVRLAGRIWAPVNAGYSSVYKYGLMYQWHRKYGQTYDEAPAREGLQGPINLDVANDIANSGRFINAQSPIVPEQEIWNMTSAYNPCPAGWEVPSVNDFAALIKEGKSSDKSGLDGLPGLWIGGNHNTDHSGSLFLPLAGDVLGTHQSQSRERDERGEYLSIADRFIVNNIYLANSNGLNIIRDQNGGLYTFLTYLHKVYGYSIRCVKKIKASPVLSTIQVSSITSSSALSGGVIEDEGGGSVTEKGVVYSTDKHPTISDNKVIASSGGGNYSITISNLRSQTTYYLRAYAINSKGASYGQEVKFATKTDLTEMPLYPGTNLKGILVESTIWAPVNAGYSSIYKFGLMYQWHRKYGQTYSESPKPNILPGPVSLATGNSEECRNNFYTILWANWANNSWSTTNPPEWPASSEYNPCPEGWRVPTYQETEELAFSGSTWTENGGIDNLPGRWYGGNHYSDHSGSVFLSASGYVTNTDCAPHGRGGDGGRYWSSTGYKINSIPADNFSTVSAYSLGFNWSYSGVNGMHRGYGIAIRCVKEK